MAAAYLSLDDACREYCQGAKWLFVLIAIIPAISLLNKALFDYVQKHENRPNPLASTLMLGLVDEVVDEKVARLSNAVKRRFSGHDFSIAEALDPLYQISEMALRIRLFFEKTILPEEGVGPYSFKVTVATVGLDAIEDILVRHPKAEVRSELDKLRDSRSTFSCAIRQDNVIIVENTVLEAKKARKTRRFVAACEDHSRIPESLVCYAFRARSLQGMGNAVPYVIAISVDSPNVFQTTKHKQYLFLLRKFEKRIIAEHYMLLLKKGDIDG